MTGDDTMLFSYFPEKFFLTLDCRGCERRLEVTKREFYSCAEGQEVTVFFWQRVITRGIRPVALMLDDE